MVVGQVNDTAGIWTTVTLNEQMLVKQIFVAVHVTSVVPTLKGLPLAGVQPVNVPPLTTGST